MFQKIKRKIVAKLKQTDSSNRREFNLNKLLTVALIFSGVLFLVSQIVINSVLTPLGSKLQALNNEKNHILEENRILEQENAKSTSLKVIKEISTKKYNFQETSSGDVRYIDDSSIVAVR